jgi:ubiquinone/menaquinone biosynthesis C-methylase UbiE
MDKKNWIKQQVRQSYSDIAAEFHQTRRKHVWPELEFLASYVKPDDSILDLGCGNGRLLKALPTVNLNYRGIEANPYLLEQAKQSYPERIFESGELPAVDLGVSCYHVVFMIAVFHHLVDREDRLAALDTIYRALQPGGYLLMTNWWLWQPRYLRDFFHWHQRKIAWNDFFVSWGRSGGKRWRYYHAFTEKELVELLQTAGFRLESQQRIGYNIVTVARKG